MEQEEGGVMKDEIKVGDVVGALAYKVIAKAEKLK
jgi:hypothetical protein